MNIVEKIMSWFSGKVVPLEDEKKMPNHEPEEMESKVYSDGRGGVTEVVTKKETTTTDETLEKIVDEKSKPKKPRKPKNKQPDSPKTKKPRKPRKPKNNNNQQKGSNK
jgi:hypothetical protein